MRFNAENHITKNKRFFENLVASLYSTVGIIFFLDNKSILFWLSMLVQTET